LARSGFAAKEIAAIMGGNWQRCYTDSFGPVAP